jgi:uncharacterized membrane protein YraQ (UPF0718 family)
MVLEIILILAVVVIVLAFIIGYVIGKSRTEKYWEEIGLPERLRKQRAVVGGLFSEQIAPYLPGFPFKPTEVRFVGKP